MKNWSYKQVTEAAERQIKNLAESAGKRLDQPIGLKLYQDWAYGVYLGWEELTAGWQKDGDNARVKAAAEAVGQQ